MFDEVFEIYVHNAVNNTISLQESVLSNRLSIQVIYNHTHKKNTIITHCVH